MDQLPGGWATRLALAWSLFAGGVAGCIYDSSDRCGDDMRYEASIKACVCVENAILVDGGCQACAADEVVASNQCVCPSGERKNADDVCVACPPAGCPSLR